MLEDISGIIEPVVHLECKSDEAQEMAIDNTKENIIKMEVDELPRLNLSKSAGAAHLLPIKRPNNNNLSNSCFANLSGNKNGDNDDLTSLSWLQDTNLLKGLTSPNNGSSAKDTSTKELLFDTSNPYKARHLGYNVMSDRTDSLRLRPAPRDDSLICKPMYSFSSLIFMAVESSLYKRLPVKDIYAWIIEHFPYFKTAPLGWKNSVRHNLSLNKCFKKVDKNKTQNVGKGSLWCIDPEYRPSLVQALRKTPAFQAYASTPPPSPLRSPRGSSYHDAEELNAAVAICSMSAHGVKKVPRRFNPREMDGSPVLLNYWRKYIEPLSDDDDDNNADGNDSGSEGSVSDSRKRSHSINPKCNIHTLLTDLRLRSQGHGSPNNSYNSWSSDYNDEYTFSDDDEEIDSNDEMEQNMKRLIEQDSLGDSGFGDTACTSPLTTDHTYTKAAKRSKQYNDKYSDSSSSLDGVAALLSLADAATQELNDMKAKKLLPQHVSFQRNQAVA